MTFNRHSTALFASLLAALVLAVYWQTAGFELITLDDFDYTVLNPLVSRGLTLEGVKQAATSMQHGSYMPVTVISFMAEVELFGLKPSVFHATNTILHLLNSLLLFSFLRRATGSTWRSFFAAALWAVHPLRAESVAWVAERKDVLAGFFFLAGLFAWGEYARERKPVFYAAALLAMALGLASKSIVIVFPAVLLIVDFWPLDRVERGGRALKKLLIEKIPFFVLSAVFSAVILSNMGKMVRGLERRGIVDRFADVATGYLYYIKETFWPVGLYMRDRDIFPYLAGASAVGAWVLLVILSALSLRFRKSAPAVSAGWWWYLAALFTVSGVLPLDYFFVADHFTYLPHIGLLVAIVWGAAMLYSRFSKDARPLIASGAALIVVLSVLSFRQVSLWKDDFVFFGYVDKMSRGKSPMAKSGLGVANYRAGRYQEAYDYFSATLLLEPNFAGASGNKGLSAAMLGKYREAAFLIEKQLEFLPDNKDLNTKLANVLIMGGDQAGGARKALENIRRWPGDKDAWEAVDYLGGEARARALAGER